MFYKSVNKNWGCCLIYYEYVISFLFTCCPIHFIDIAERDNMNDYWRLFFAHTFFINLFMVMDCEAIVRTWNISI